MLVRTKGGKGHLRRRTSKRTKRVHRLAPYLKKAA
jgi:hypothetical protein